MLVASCLEEAPERLEAGVRGSEPARSVLTFFRGKPDHPSGRTAQGRRILQLVAGGRSQVTQVVLSLAVLEL